MDLKSPPLPWCTLGSVSRLAAAKALYNGEPWQAWLPIASKLSKILIQTGDNVRPVSVDRPYNTNMWGLVSGVDNSSIHCYGCVHQLSLGYDLGVPGDESKQLGLRSHQLQLVFLAVHLGQLQDCTQAIHGSCQQSYFISQSSTTHHNFVNSVIGTDHTGTPTLLHFLFLSLLSK